MDFADIVFKRIEGEDNPKKSLNTLICFSKENTGKALGVVIDKIARNRAGKSYITLINTIDREQALEIEDDNVYKSNLFSGIVKQGESDKLTIRTFVKQYDNYVNDILKTAEEYNSDLILIGAEIDVFSSSIWKKYLKLKTDKIIDEEIFFKELGEQTTKTLRDVSTIMNRNDQTTGVLIVNKLEKIENIFVPILKDEDVFTLIYLYQFLKNQDISATVWDSIGILNNNQKMQKIFSTITKKADGRVRLWNNNKKIGVDFMKEQDLMVIARNGWEKLIDTPLCWIYDLPSTLIIKDKKTET